MKPFWIVALLALVACETSNKEIVAPEKTEKSEPIPATKVEAKEAPKIEKKAEPKKEVFASDTVVKRRFEDEKLGEYEVLGMVDSGISWSDRKGRNLLIFSKVTKKAEQTFHIRHYVKSTAGLEKRIELKEYLYCDREKLAINVHKDRFSVQDLDKDGIGEATFAYAVECDDDAPNLFKLFLLEDGEKYKLTGPIKKTFALGKYEAYKNKKPNPLFLKYLSEEWTRKR